jgi:hypothetical protein
LTTNAARSAGFFPLASPPLCARRPPSLLCRPSRLPFSCTRRRLRSPICDLMPPLILRTDLARDIRASQRTSAAPDATRRLQQSTLAGASRGRDAARDGRAVLEEEIDRMCVRIASRRRSSSARSGIKGCVDGLDERGAEDPVMTAPRREARDQVLSVLVVESRWPSHLVIRGRGTCVS